MWEVMTNMKRVVSYSTAPSLVGSTIYLAVTMSDWTELNWIMSCLDFHGFKFPACRSESLEAFLVSPGRALASRPSGPCLSSLWCSQTLLHQGFYMGGSTCSGQESTHSRSGHLYSSVGFTACSLWSVVSSASLFLSLAVSKMKLMTLSSS